MTSSRNGTASILFCSLLLVLMGCSAVTETRNKAPKLTVREICLGRYEPALLQLARMRMEQPAETPVFSEEDAMEEAYDPMWPMLMIPPMLDPNSLPPHRPAEKVISAVSPDGKHWVFAKRFADGVCFLRVDGAWKGRSEDIRCVRFSPDSQRLAYAVKVWGKWHIQVDSNFGEAYSDISALKFSPDSKRLLFVASNDTKGESVFVVVDGKRGKEYRNIWGLVFSPDSRHYAYLAADEGQNGIIIEDGVELGKCFLEPAFSPDSRHFAFALFEDNGFTLMKDGVKVGGKFDRIRYIFFSPDSQHVVFIGMRDKKECVVIDGVEKKVFDTGERICFSEDSRHVAYVVDQDGMKRVVLNDVEGKPYRRIQDIRFQPGTSRLYYIGMRESGSVVVADGVEGKEYKEVFSDLIFSPDGKRVAYLAGRQFDGEAFVVADGRELIKCASKESPGIPIFSPDSQHVAYSCLTGNDPFHRQPFFGVDGTRTTIIDGTLASMLTFDAPDRCHALVMRGAELYLIEITIEE